MPVIPRENDVLFGKGTAINHHPGNLILRVMVDTQKSKMKYNMQKRFFAANIIDDIRKSGARFLMEDPGTKDKNWTSSDFVDVNGQDMEHSKGVHPSILNKVWILVEKDELIMTKVLHRFREKGRAAEDSTRSMFRDRRLRERDNKLREQQRAVVKSWEEYEKEHEQQRQALLSRQRYEQQQLLGLPRETKDVDMVESNSNDDEAEHPLHMRLAELKQDPQQHGKEEDRTAVAETVVSEDAAKEKPQLHTASQQGSATDNDKASSPSLSNNVSRSALQNATTIVRQQRLNLQQQLLVMRLQQEQQLYNNQIGKASSSPQQQQELGTQQQHPKGAVNNQSLIADALHANGAANSPSLIADALQVRLLQQQQQFKQQQQQLFSRLRGEQNKKAGQEFSNHIPIAQQLVMEQKQEQGHHKHSSPSLENEISCAESLCFLARSA